MSPDNSTNESPDPPYNTINPSNKLLANYGLLFILWGWTSALRIALDLVEKYAYISISLRWMVEILGYLLLMAWLVGTIYFLYKQRDEKLTYFGLSMRFIWISLILSLSLVSLVLANVLGNINFELQHPVFMIFIAFAIVLSGGILRYKLLIIGGILFAMCAVVSSYLELKDQMALEAVGWIVGFVIPGHLMYAKRMKKS